MTQIDIQPGHSYKLKRNLEIREEHTGTMKAFYLGGTVLKVRKVVPEEDQVFVEGQPMHIPLAAFQRMVTEAE